MKYHWDDLPKARLWRTEYYGKRAVYRLDRVHYGFPLSVMVPTLCGGFRNKNEMMQAERTTDTDRVTCKYCLKLLNEPSKRSLGCSE